VGLGRAVETVRIRYCDVEWINGDLRRLTKPDDWASLLTNVDAVINAAGVLQDGPGDDVVAVQSTAMHALFRSCDTQCVRRIVQISAVGAEADAPTRFMTSKADADAALSVTDLEWIILRPGLVIGPTAYGATALLRALASVPFLLPIAFPRVMIQTVYVADVADAALLAVEGRVQTRRAYDLVEPGIHRFDDVLSAFRSWFGLPSDRRIIVPDALTRAAFRLGDALGRLGWRSPLRSTALKQAEASITGDPTGWCAASGREMLPLPETLRRMPASVQERWFARMWLLKPIAIGGLALFWIVSGIIALARFETARTILLAHGLPIPVATAAVLIGSAIDIMIGLGFVVRRTMPAAAIASIAATLAYLIAGSVWTTNLRLDPLGPFLKDIPLVLLALVTLAIAPDR